MIRPTFVQYLLVASLVTAATTSGNALANPDAEEAAMAPIDVTVDWPERTPLPPGARLVVTVADTARAGAPAQVLVERTLEDPPPPPIHVELALDGVALDPRARYSARAQVLVGEQLRMTSDQVHPVLRTSEDRRVVVILRELPARSGRPATPPDAALVNTYWRLTRLLGEALVAEPGRREASLVLREVDGRLDWSGTVGCNRLMGSFERSGASIRFADGGVSTRMACPPPIAERERTLREVLSRVAGWRISGDHLGLLDAAGSTLIEAEAVYLD
jgi:heat shock protein HslJ/uncharacterized lipoprotein YbaY